MDGVPALIVTVSGLLPGAPLDAAVGLADALDARRVPLTLLVGPRPHPEVAAWAAARRYVGDAVLLHGTRDIAEDSGAHPYRRAPQSYRRLPAHEAGLRLAGALRARDALGPAVDGFAAPGWALSPGTRAALAAAGVLLCVDDDGVHRLSAPGEHAETGTVAASRRGPVSGPAAPGSRRPRRFGGPVADLVHLALSMPRDAHVAGGLVDRALAAGTTPAAATDLLARATPSRRRGTPDPEQWSITA
jgi:hypothetical protein